MAAELAVGPAPSRDEAVQLAEDRLLRLEAELDRLRPSLSERLDRLERGAAERPRTGLRAFVAWMGPALPQLITAIVVLGVGWAVKDSVDVALKREQLTLSYAKEMKDLLAAMDQDGASVGEVSRAAVTLAGFGPAAIMPLLNELGAGGNRALGAERGLRSIAFTSPDAVCALLPRVMASAVKPLEWEAQASCARLLAAGGCLAALPLLERQRAVLDRARSGEPAAVEVFVRTQPSVVQLKEWLASVVEAIAVLGVDAGRRR